MRDERLEVLEIDVNNLLLDLQNPRAKAADSQLDEIRKVFEASSGSEMAALAKSIIENGQNPMELLGVIKDEGSEKYIALEGNRRVVALKLLGNPSLAPDQKIQRAFERIVKDYGADDIPTSLNCCVFPSRKAAATWIQLKHTGENGGVGTKRWKTNQQRRFMVNEMGASPARSDLVAEYLQDNIHFEWAGGTDAIYDINNLTTLQRILSFKGMLEFMHLHEEGGKIVSDDDEFSAKILHKVYMAVDSGSIGARDVYNAESAFAFVGKIATAMGLVPAELEVPKEENVQLVKPPVPEEPPAVPTVPPEEVPIPKTTQRTTPGGPNLSTRNKIICNNDYYITGVTGKAGEILKELKKISCTDYPVASALLIRCFYEMTTKKFIEENNIVVERKLKSVLGELFFKCKERIISNGTEKEKDNAGKFSIHEKKGSHSIDQLEDLNNVIHDPVVLRDKVFFFTTWDTFRPFIQDLWNNMPKDKKR